MKYNSLEKSLREKLDVQIRDVTPGVMVRAYQGGRLVCDVQAGNVFPYYDFASLTKVIFTVQGMMEAFDQKKWNLDTTVSSILPWFPFSTVLVKNLMNHSSGLPWWIPFYKDMPLNLSMTDKRDHLKKIISQQTLTESEKSVYSDVGFIVLGYILEQFHEKKLWDVWTDLKEKYYQGTTMDFHPNNLSPQKISLYAPTEECPWRQKLIQGEVHDENTWSLGGVSSHAGLFGSIDDLGWYSLHLRSQMMGIARYSLRQKTTLLFTQKSMPDGCGDWTLGFMQPTPGSSSSGKYFSEESVGHTGFTGTSMWYDPKNDLSVAILSNRVLYGRENKSFNQLRPLIHDWIVEGLRRSAL